MKNKGIGNIKDYTPKFKLIIPRFDIATWHDYIEENFRNIDALFFNLFGINNYSGPWKQITSYTEDQVLFISDDRDINGEETIYSGRLVKVLIEHTTDNSDYFSTFYSIHPEYYELFADASSVQIFAQQAQNSANEAKTSEINAKNSENVAIEKQNEINNTVSVFNEDVLQKSEQLATQIADGVEIMQQETAISAENVEKSRIWAEGEQEEVQNIGGNLSSMGSADLAYALANADEDVPIDTSNMFAMNIFKGEKGEPGKDGESIFNGYATNYITEIPQDIKLELNNDTQTLKAGSKVYVPNGKNADGSLRFDVIVIGSDIVHNYQSTTTGQTMLFLYPSRVIGAYFYDGDGISQGYYSGSTAPSGYTYMTWYDTTNNFVKYTDNGGSTWTSGCSLPIAIGSYSNTWTSIDQVFNGFGYIGSTVFALPGVKGLIPNGRNEDGSLKNIEFETSKVLTFTDNLVNRPAKLFINNNEFFIWGSDNNNVVYLDTRPSVAPNIWCRAYIKDENKWLYAAETTEWKSEYLCVDAGDLFMDSNSKITSFQPKLPFRAVDYSDSSWIAAQVLPSGKYIDLTLGATGSNYTAPANGWIMLSQQGSSANKMVSLVNVSAGELQSTSKSTVGTNDVYIPVKKSDTFRAFYDGSITKFRFIYAKGEN